MSEYEHRDGGGSIFRNKKKTSEKQPDFKGEIKINNIVYEFGVWEKRSDKGTVWLSIGGARPKQDKGEQKHPQDPSNAVPVHKQLYGGNLSKQGDEIVDQDPFGFDSQIPF